MMSDAPKNAPPVSEDRDAKVLEYTREHYRKLLEASQGAYDRALQEVKSVAKNLHWTDEYKKELDDRLTTAEKHLNLAKDCLRDASPLWIQQRRLALLQVAATLVAAHPLFKSRSESDGFMEREVVRLADSFEDYVAAGRQPY
jgi:phage-related tail protein